jgi:hypothetical protein
MEHIAEARRLVEPLPASEAKARVIVQARGSDALGAEDEAIRVGEEALAMAEPSAPTRSRPLRSITIGSARAALGEERGIDEIAQASSRDGRPTLLSRCVGGWAISPPGSGPSGSWPRRTRRWHEAELEGRELRPGGLRALVRGVLVRAGVEFGEWDAALRAADAFLADVEAGSPHYLAAQATSPRA